LKVFFSKRIDRFFIAISNRVGSIKIDFYLD
jgi:hypothetical protein